MINAKYIPITVISLTITVFLLGILYVFLLNQTMTNTSLALKMSREISNKAVAVSEKEFEYIARKNQITIDYAEVFGFKEIGKVSYITRAGAPALSSNVR